MELLIDNRVYISYETPCADIVIAECEDNRVTVKLPEDRWVTVVRPLRRQIAAAQTMVLPCPAKLAIEFDTGSPLFVFLYQPETVRRDAYTYYFAPGEHRMEQLDLHTGDRVYIAAGAILRTHIRAQDAQDIQISGRGIVDTAGIGRKKRRMLHFANCQQLRLQDVTLLGAIDWCVVPLACSDFSITGVNCVTWEVNGDGIDLVGCKNGTVENCFIRTADDCVAVKATDYDDPRGCADCRNLTITGCILWNARPGNALEIGFETRCDSISHVRFLDCDVLHCDYEGWQSGGVFTIHNGDRARVHDILYADIRVEDAQQKLFDFKVLQSQYSKDTGRGFIENITARNIQVLCDYLPPSIFRGCDNAHGIRNMTITGLTHRGKPVTSLLDGHMIAESGSEIRFSK